MADQARARDQRAVLTGIASIRDTEAARRWLLRPARQDKLVEREPGCSSLQHARCPRQRAAQRRQDHKSWLNKSGRLSKVDVCVQVALQSPPSLS
jgi:hypothetical protein